MLEHAHRAVARRPRGRGRPHRVLEASRAPGLRSRGTCPCERTSKWPDGGTPRSSAAAPPGHSKPAKLPSPVYVARLACCEARCRGGTPRRRPAGTRFGRAIGVEQFRSVAFSLRPGSAAAPTRASAPTASRCYAIHSRSWLQCVRLLQLARLPSEPVVHAPCLKRAHRQLRLLPPPRYLGSGAVPRRHSTQKAHQAPHSAPTESPTQLVPHPARETS